MPAAGHTMQQPMQQEGQQEQEQQDGAIAAAEQRLLELHGRLWGLATELLLRPTERDDAEEQPQPSRASPPRPPRAIIEDIKRCRAEADAFWAEWAEAGGKGEGGKGVWAAAAEERTKQAARRERERVVVQLRSRFVGRTTEAFADELDALRRTDASFKGTEEDVRGLIAMLEEGAEALLAEGDEATLGLYRDHLRGEGEEDEGDSSPDILDEPVHARVRREKGMELKAAASPSLGSTKTKRKGAAAAAASAARAVAAESASSSSSEEEDGDGMEESSGSESEDGSSEA